MRAEQKAGISTNYATAAVLENLIPGWEESLKDSISCSVLVHDLIEVAHNLRSIHSILSKKLPGVLDELAAIAPDPGET
jgi:hypothetical protein